MLLAADQNPLAGFSIDESISSMITPTKQHPYRLNNQLNSFNCSTVSPLPSPPDPSGTTTVVACGVLSSSSSSHSVASTCCFPKLAAMTAINHHQHNDSTHKPDTATTNCVKTTRPCSLPAGDSMLEMSSRGCLSSKNIQDFPSPWLGLHPPDGLSPVVGTMNQLSVRSATTSALPQLTESVYSSPRLTERIAIPTNRGVLLPVSTTSNVVPIPHTPYSHTSPEHTLVRPPPHPSKVLSIPCIPTSTNVLIVEGGVSYPQRQSAVPPDSMPPKALTFIARFPRMSPRSDGLRGGFQLDLDSVAAAAAPILTDMGSTVLVALTDGAGRIVHHTCHAVDPSRLAMLNSQQLMGQSWTDKVYRSDQSVWMGHFNHVINESRRWCSRQVVTPKRPMNDKEHTSDADQPKAIYCPRYRIELSNQLFHVQTLSIPVHVSHETESQLSSQTLKQRSTSCELRVHCPADWRQDTQAKPTLIVHYHRLHNDNDDLSSPACSTAEMHAPTRGNPQSSTMEPFSIRCTDTTTITPSWCQQTGGGGGGCHPTVSSNPTCVTSIAPPRDTMCSQRISTTPVGGPLLTPTHPVTTTFARNPLSAATTTTTNSSSVGGDQKRPADEAFFSLLGGAPNLVCSTSCTNSRVNQSLTDTNKRDPVAMAYTTTTPLGSNKPTQMYQSRVVSQGQSTAPHHHHHNSHPAVQASDTHHSHEHRHHLAHDEKRHHHHHHGDRNVPPVTHSGGMDRKLASVDSERSTPSRSRPIAVATTPTPIAPKPATVATNFSVVNGASGCAGGMVVVGGRLAEPASPFRTGQPTCYGRSVVPVAASFTNSMAPSPMISRLGLTDLINRTDTMTNNSMLLVGLPTSASSSVGPFLPADSSVPDGHKRRNHHGERIQSLQNQLPPEAVQQIRQIWHEIYGQTLQDDDVPKSEQAGSTTNGSIQSKSAVTAAEKNSADLRREQFARRVRQVVRQYLGPNALVSNSNNHPGSINRGRMANVEILPVPTPASETITSVLFPASSVIQTPQVHTHSMATSSQSNCLAQGPRSVGSVRTTNSEMKYSQESQRPSTTQVALSDNNSQALALRTQPSVTTPIPNRTVVNPNHRPAAQVQHRPSPTSTTAARTVATTPTTAAAPNVCITDLRPNRRSSSTSSSQCCMLEWLLSEEADLGLLPATFYDSKQSSTQTVATMANSFSSSTSSSIPDGPLEEKLMQLQRQRVPMHSSSPMTTNAGDSPDSVFYTQVRSVPGTVARGFSMSPPSASSTSFAGQMVSSTVDSMVSPLNSTRPSGAGLVSSGCGSLLKQQHTTASPGATNMYGGVSRGEGRDQSPRLQVNQSSVSPSSSRRTSSPTCHGDISPTVATSRAGSLLVRLLHPSSSNGLPTNNLSDRQRRSSSSLGSEPPSPIVSATTTTSLMDPLPRRSSDGSFSASQSHHPSLIINLCTPPLSSRNTNSLTTPANVLLVASSPSPLDSEVSPYRTNAKRRRSGPPIPRSNPIPITSAGSGGYAGGAPLHSRSSPTRTRIRHVSSNQYGGGGGPGRVQPSPPITSLTQLLLQDFPSASTSESSSEFDGPMSTGAPATTSTTDSPRPHSIRGLDDDSPCKHFNPRTRTPTLFDDSSVVMMGLEPTLRSSGATVVTGSASVMASSISRVRPISGPAVAPTHGIGITSGGGGGGIGGGTSSSLCRLLLDPHLGGVTSMVTMDDISTTTTFTTTNGTTRYRRKTPDVYDFSAANSFESSSSSPSIGSRSVNSTPDMMRMDTTCGILPRHLVPTTRMTPSLQSRSSSQMLQMEDDDDDGGSTTYRPSAAAAADNGINTSQTLSPKAIAEEVEFLNEILRRDELERSGSSHEVVVVATTTNSLTSRSPSSEGIVEGSYSPKSKRSRLASIPAGDDPLAFDRDGPNGSTLSDQSDAQAVARICEQLQQGFTSSRSMSTVLDSPVTTGQQRRLSGSLGMVNTSDATPIGIDLTQLDQRSPLTHGTRVLSATCSPSLHSPQSTGATPESQSWATQLKNKAAAAAAEASLRAAVHQRRNSATQRLLTERKRLLQHQWYNQVTVYSPTPTSNSPSVVSADIASTPTATSTSSPGSCSVALVPQKSSTNAISTGRSPIQYMTNPSRACDNSSPVGMTTNVATTAPINTNHTTLLPVSTATVVLPLSAEDGLQLTCTTVVASMSSRNPAVDSVAFHQRHRPEELSRYLREVAPNVKVQLSSMPSTNVFPSDQYRVTSECTVIGGLPSSQPTSIQSSMRPLQHTDCIPNPAVSGASARTTTTTTNWPQVILSRDGLSMYAGSNDCSSTMGLLDETNGSFVLGTLAPIGPAVNVDSLATTTTSMSKVRASPCRSGGGTQRGARNTSGRILHRIPENSIEQQQQLLLQTHTHHVPDHPYTGLTNAEPRFHSTMVPSRTNPVVMSTTYQASPSPMNTALEVNCGMGPMNTGHVIPQHFNSNTSLEAPLQRQHFSPLSSSNNNPIHHPVWVMTQPELTTTSSQIGLYSRGQKSVSSRVEHTTMRSAWSPEELHVNVNQNQSAPTVVVPLSHDTSVVRAAAAAPVFGDVRHGSGVVYIEDHTPTQVTVAIDPNSGAPERTELVLDAMLDVDSRHEDSLLPEDIINDVFDLETMVVTKQRQQQQLLQQQQHLRSQPPHLNEPFVLDDEDDDDAPSPVAMGGMEAAGPDATVGGRVNCFAPSMATDFDIYASIYPSQAAFPSTASSSPSPCSPRLNSTLPPDSRSYLSP